jgi:4-carboxymuconolactone decarboxylase
MVALRAMVLWMMVAAALLAGLGSRSAVAQEKLPSDIDPDSRSRIPRAKREDLQTEEEKKAFDRLVPDAGAQTGPLGPTGTRLHFPIPAEMFRDAIRWVREKSGVEPRFAELAILVATRETPNYYEWLAHEPSARTAGISPETMDAVRNKKDPKGLPEKEEILIRYGREMIRGPKVSSATFAGAERAFGRKGTLALTMILSHYSGSSMMLRAYDQHVRPDQKAPFPIP